MTQSWHKIGRIFNPDILEDFEYSHASVPFVNSINSDILEVYFTSRDQNDKSYLFSSKFSISQNFKLISYQTKPLISPGNIGEFDEYGVMGCQSVNINDTKFLYYIGWNLGTSVPFRNSIGVAEFKDNKWIKKFNGPILDRSIYDPCFVASSNIIKIDNQYIMYYLSCDSWTKIKGKITHKYNIKIATSKDGIDWERKGQIAIDYQNPYEYAFSTPRVIKEDGIYKMWYSYRASKNYQYYKIGYAESFNGFDWLRKDNLQTLQSSPIGWDSEMVCYPFIFEIGNTKYMLYNGNGYGKTGIGLAYLNKKIN